MEVKSIKLYLYLYIYIQLYTNIFRLLGSVVTSVITGQEIPDLISGPPMCFFPSGKLFYGTYEILEMWWWRRMEKMKFVRASN